MVQRAIETPYSAAPHAMAAAGYGARIVVRQIDPELLKKMGSKAEGCDVTNIMYGGPRHD